MGILIQASIFGLADTVRQTVLLECSPKRRKEKFYFPINKLLISPTTSGCLSHATDQFVGQVFFALCSLSLSLQHSRVRVYRRDAKLAEERYTRGKKWERGGRVIRPFNASNIIPSHDLTACREKTWQIIYNKPAPKSYCLLDTCQTIK